MPVPARKEPEAVLSGQRLVALLAVGPSRIPQFVRLGNVDAPRLAAEHVIPFVDGDFEVPLDQLMGGRKTSDAPPDDHHALLFHGSPSNQELGSGRCTTNPRGRRRQFVAGKVSKPVVIARQLLANGRPAERSARSLRSLASTLPSERPLSTNDPPDS